MIAPNNQYWIYVYALNDVALGKVELKQGFVGFDALGFVEIYDWR